jgi:hypothetical protein
MLKINHFPHAHYDPKEHSGYLAYYYPYESVKDKTLEVDLWRNQSYSPNILNFKEGEQGSVEYFKNPFLELISHALSTLDQKETYLVPVPSSIAWNDPAYSRKPRAKGDKRNRDDRNIIFCNCISSANTLLKVADILVRTTGKTEKMTWNANQHAQSLALSGTLLSKEFDGVLVLVDDVVTNGGTMSGAKIVLQKEFPKAMIVCLSIGSSRSPQDFEALTP